jgi:hypothetical protein
MGESAGEDGRPERELRRPEGGRTAAAGAREGARAGEIGVGGGNVRKPSPPQPYEWGSKSLVRL